jgi:Family of unknown function (DUF5947)
LASFTIAIDGTVTAHYPSAVGATTWEVSTDSWNAVLRDCPPLKDIAPAVEAFL